MEKHPKQKLYFSKSCATLQLTTFEFEIIYPTKITSDGEMTKTKIVGLEELKNFVVDNFFI